MSILAIRSDVFYAFLTRPSIHASISSIGLRNRYISTTYRPIPAKKASETNNAVRKQRELPLQHQKAAVNPPESTLPPHLEVPVRQPEQGTISYYYKVGKSYLGFYKTALKAVLANYRESKAIASRLPTRDSKGSPLSFVGAVRSGLLTRSEYQFILRSRRDIKKLPLLGLLLVICGEYLPVVVIFVSGLVPRTAWIPKQVERARTKLEKRREESFREGTLRDKEALVQICKSNGLDNLSPLQILHISRSLGLHSSLWETFWDRPPRWIAKLKTRKAIDYLNTDDYALVRDGDVRGLSDEEVKMACEDRGIDVLKFDIDTLRKRLDVYLKWRTKRDVPVPAMVLLRPSNWDKLVTATK